MPYSWYFMWVINANEMAMCCILVTFQYTKSHTEVMMGPRKSFLFGIILTLKNQSILDLQN